MGVAPGSHVKIFNATEARTGRIEQNPQKIGRFRAVVEVYGDVDEFDASGWEAAPRKSRVERDGRNSRLLAIQPITIQNH
jgi:hypothetical protein